MAVPGWTTKADDTGTAVTRIGRRTPPSYYYHATATGTTPSSWIRIEQGTTCTLTMNANSGGTGAHSVSAALELATGDVTTNTSPGGTNDTLVVGGIELTGVFPLDAIYDIPAGLYRINVSDAPATNPSVFKLEVV